MEAYQDGVNADRNASDYKKVTMQVNRNNEDQTSTREWRRMGRANPSIELTQVSGLSAKREWRPSKFRHLQAESAQ